MQIQLLGWAQGAKRVREKRHQAMARLYDRIRIPIGGFHPVMFELIATGSEILAHFTGISGISSEQTR